MKLATLAICTFLSFSAFAQVSSSGGVQILEVESTGGELNITLNSSASAAKKGLLLKKIMAQKEAKNLAKASISGALKNICRAASLSEEDYILPEAECNEQGEDIKCSFNKVQVRCSEISEKKTLELKLEIGLIKPSSACIELIEGDYRIDNEIINNCNRIKTKTQFQCVSTLTSYSSIKTMAIRACAVFASDLSQQVLAAYKDRGFEAPTPSLIVLLAAANTSQEATCIKNKLKLSSLIVQDLENSCIEDTKLELDKREYEALGFVTNPRTIQYRLRGVVGH